MIEPSCSHHLSSSRSSVVMSDSRRRRAQAGKAPVPRSHSTFFGTIKGIVTAPLNWFTSSDTEEFEDDTNGMGKRHRQAAALPAGVDSDGPTPSKRQRVRSPNSEFNDSGIQSAYLDPPVAVFPQQSQRASTLSPRRNVKSISLSHVPEKTALNAPRVLSPLRQQFSRNMIIEKPSVKQLTRDVSMKSIVPLGTDVSMENISIRRDHSMPPLTSSKPSFKMRSSLTPQLSRESSEPPPVSTLKSKPVFVHPPAGLSRKPSMTMDTSMTLGSLADNSRRVRGFPFRSCDILICL